ncbi:hypothetical protein HC174_12655 [Salinimicrobium sp. CDJ15-81-2]|nr:hypothetical protein [Salinimicrobium nanhaiense]
MNKEEIKAKEALLIALTNDFCIQQINEEYAELCQRLIKKMGRKREVPFKRGKAEIWAATVIYTIGSINFLFDKSFEPYIESKRIHDHFGTKSSTITNKAADIKKMFDLWYYNPEFSTGAMLDNNPMNNLVMVDDLIVPVNSLPEDMQELVKQARAQGKDISFTTKE